MDKIIAVLRANQDKAPDELVNDFQNLPVNPQTNEYDRDASAAFVKKWAPYIQENFENWEEIDYSANEPLKDRMVKDGVNPTLMGNTNYLEGLARKYGSTPEEVSKTFFDILKDKQAEGLKKQLADEYKKEAEARYARQKAVDDYQHQYGIPILDQFGIGPKMDVDNPINKGLNWLADQIISDKTKRAVVEDPNASGRIAGNVATDIVGTGLDFAPGYGYLLAPVVRTGRNIAEGDKALDVAKEAGADIIGSVALGQGLKGLPVARDLGPLHKVEEKIPLNEWAAKAKTAKTPVKNVALELPPADPKEIGKWIEKQPAELRKEYYKVIEENPSNVREALIKKIDELGDIANKDTYKQMIAEQWVKENPWKARIGERGEQGILGTERTLAVKPFQTDTEYKTSNPKKIKTYDDAIGFIIDTNKRQWEAGFKPRDMSGIVGDAYRKWESER